MGGGAIHGVLCMCVKRGELGANTYYWVVSCTQWVEYILSQCKFISILTTRTVCLGGCVVCENEVKREKQHYIKKRIIKQSYINKKNSVNTYVPTYLIILLNWSIMSYWCHHNPLESHTHTLQRVLNLAPHNHFTIRLGSHVYVMFLLLSRYYYTCISPG